ncbi:LON peptidase substrate-binding domain-containing protein [Parvularcula maris]|uniref:LON peptidase substrate-binding domain-containing protein n=1 Tax=Parvularcula maris TaxID=2965077 RepID=A0A9X2LBJ1_9PROT|nr:LON peptidase substrate-binding domain-containing protein [Parvularcula maris]MCQ8186444.1 LON peptidase substrate-binding domain-containing protein [Parvularcula maris]
MHFNRQDAVLPTKLPIFPLRSAMLLPRAQLPLNIFEPRYLAMTEYALGHGRLIGMVRPKYEDDPEGTLYDIGCAGRITSFMETGDGRFLLTLTGLCRFRLEGDELTDGGFREAEVDWSAFALDHYQEPEENPHLRDRVIELLMEYLEEVGLRADWDSIEGASAETIINSVSMSCPFEPDEKQAILEARSIEERGDALVALMQMAIATKRSELGDDEVSERLQ